MNDFCAGVFLGGLVVAILAAMNVVTYRRILRQCAEQKTPEKLGDSFYYIVPESEYVDLTCAKLRESMPQRGTE